MSAGVGGTCPGCAVRPATVADLERVVELDRARGGVSRRGFFEKRWQAMDRDAGAFVALVAELADGVSGFVLAHLIDGEFGAEAPAAVLDAIAVDPAAGDRGIGAALVQSLTETVRSRGAREMRTQTRWDDSDLVHFFARSGFRLAPRVVLERSTTAPGW